MSVSVCQHYVNGYCKFGDSCRFIHPPRTNLPAFRQNAGGRGFGGSNSVPQGSGQTNRMTSQNLTEDEKKYGFTAATIVSELEALPTWIISTFGVAAKNPNLFIEPDISQEEMRWKCVQAVEAGNPQQYVTEENDLLNKAKQNISLALSNPSQTLAVAQKLYDARFINGLGPGSNRPKDFDEAKVLAAATSSSQNLPSTSAFGKSAFGQTSTPPAFGASSFGQSSKPKAFGGSANAFGSGNAAPNAFGSSSFGQKPAGSTGFGSSSTPAPAFGSGAAATPAFGSTSKPAFGSSSFGQSGGTGGSAFGQSGFGAKFTSGFGAATTPAFSSTTPTAPAAFGASKPAFGSTTPAFGQSATSGLGQLPNPSTAFGQTSTPAFGTSTFGSPAPAATGGGFGQSAFGQTAKPAAFGSSPLASTTAFGSAASPAQPAAFGSTSTPAFGQSGFGQTSAPANPFGTPAPQAANANPAPASNPFGNPSSTPLANPFAQTSNQPSASGATPNPFAQTSTTPSPFGQAQTTSSNPFANTSSAAQANVSTPPTIPQVGREAGEWSYDDPWSCLLPTPNGDGDDRLDDELVKLFQAPRFSLAAIPSLPPPIALRS